LQAAQGALGLRGFVRRFDVGRFHAAHIAESVEHLVDPLRFHARY
jgi:hypothetical protein